MQTPAKNFSGQYPLNGTLIGPAWRSLWGALDSRRWQRGRALAAELAPGRGVSEKTIAGLLWQAHKAGHVQKRIVKVKTAGGRAVEYRGIE